jgi:BioD-like phosphotransacetylase family protein
MKAIYVTSTEPYSGKSAVCLALGRNLQAKGLKIGYLKPVSTQPWRTSEGELADEDAAFFCKMLNLDENPSDLSPTVITPSLLRSRLRGLETEDLLENIIKTAERISQDKDILILEGGASLREGYAMGLSNLSVAEALGAPALVMIRYHKEMQILDDVFAAHLRLGEQYLGVIFNHVPGDGKQFIDEYARPFLEEQGLTLLGSLPSQPRLSALSIGELVDLLHAEILTEHYDPDTLAEVFTVGAMTIDAALSRFRRQQNKAVITGGDRSDIQLAALETSTVLLILTGYLHPSPVVLHQAESLGVPVLLVKGNTMETVETIERAYGKTRLGQPEKLDAFMQLIDNNVALGIIYKSLGIDN